MSDQVLTTLGDLGEVRTAVALKRPDGRTVTVLMRTLSEQEMWELRQAMRPPEPPFELGRWDGPDRPVTKKFNREDATYVKRAEEHGRRFSRILLARALVMDIPGATTDDERAAALERNLGAWASTQLTAQMNRMLGIADEEVDAAADTFPAA